MAISDALAHLDDALDALTLEAYRGQDTDSMERVAPIQATLAIELERIDMALGPRGQSMFAPIAEEIKRAVIAIVAAQESLKEAGRQQGLREAAEVAGKCPVRYATVRDGGDEWHIECRFKDGQKFAAVTVVKEHEDLADWIAAAITALMEGEGE